MKLYIHKTNKKVKPSFYGTRLEGLVRVSIVQFGCFSWEAPLVRDITPVPKGEDDSVSEYTKSGFFNPKGIEVRTPYKDLGEALTKPSFWKRFWEGVWWR